MTISEDADGRIDLRCSSARSGDRRTGRSAIGSFSAASNVTGILSDTRAISILLHRHGALSFWDFAAAAPYVDIDMAPHRPGPDAELDYKDAIVLSPHKFIGGPGTPGVLVARRELFRNRVPASPGGGTVVYVNPLEHVYLADPEHREEGGTPAIIESIRAGLAFQLKERVGRRAHPRPRGVVHRSGHGGLGCRAGHRLLGNPALPRLSIVSFTIRHDGRYLHHNYVVALLNDLFGIQSRGGCSCAGPYGHRLLGIDIETSHAFEREISRGCEGIKPGWVRVNFNYFISEAVFDYLVGAVALVARDGWRLLPWYRFDPATGMWRHTRRLTRGAAVAARHHLRTRRAALPGPPPPRTRVAPRGLPRRGERILADPTAVLGPAPEPEPLDVGTDFESLRWFWLPDEIGAAATSQ